MTELKPRMNRILKMLEPIIFPTAISLFLFMAATTDVANSGNEVPMDTTVRLIKLFANTQQSGYFNSIVYNKPSSGYQSR